MASELRFCPSCDDQRWFEYPPCVEGHGAACPERVCLDCGTAVLVDPPAVPPRRRPALRPAVNPAA